MGDSGFYRQLEIAGGITRRRELIFSLLKNSDLVSLFGEEVKSVEILEDLAIPSDPMNRLSLPFAVGFKYGTKELCDESQEIKQAYLLRIVRLPSGEENFLTVCDDGMFHRLNRHCLINPFFT